MTTKPNSGPVSVSRELLVDLLDAAKWKAADFAKGTPYRTTIDGIVRQTKDLLAQLADQQGEPVVLPTDWRSLADQLQEVGLAYWKAHDRERDRGAVKFLHNEETGALFVVTRGEYADQLKDFIFSLDCPAQPATAKVVLPERMPGISHTDSYEEGWNACLDEVAKLNNIGEKP